MLRRVEFIGSGYESVRFFMVDTPTIAEAYEAAEKWYKETGQNFHYIGMEIPKEYAYNESIDTSAGGVAKLSDKAQKLLGFLREEYKDNGYLYSGSWPYNSLTERGFGKDVIHELQQEGKIQRRDCEDYAFELSTTERGNLITNHNLCSFWYEKHGDALLPEIQQEMRNVADVVESSLKNEMGLVSVRTMKVVGDSKKPDRIEVPCAFSVGQVVNLEYDLPKRQQHTGYSGITFVPRGKAVGQFMVTDVIHNLLVQPSINLLEVQSLCEEFNKLYPQERTMMVFEDVLLKRMKEVEGTLEQKLENAIERSVNAQDKDIDEVLADASERSGASVSEGKQSEIVKE